MSPEVRSNGGIMVDVFAAIYIFIALSVICEDYFVPSLEVICDGEYCSKRKLAPIYRAFILMLFQSC